MKEKEISKQLKQDNERFLKKNNFLKPLKAEKKVERNRIKMEAGNNDDLITKEIAKNSSDINLLKQATNILCLMVNIKLKPRIIFQKEFEKKNIKLGNNRDLPIKKIGDTAAIINRVKQGISNVCNYLKIEPPSQDDYRKSCYNELLKIKTEAGNNKDLLIKKIKRNAAKINLIKEKTYEILADLESRSPNFVIFPT